MGDPEARRMIEDLMQRLGGQDGGPEPEQQE